MSDAPGKKIGISIMLTDMPSPEKSCEHRRPPIEDQVRSRIDRIHDGSACLQDFLVLKRLQETLRQKKPCTPRIQSIMDMIEPVMRKFGYYF